MHPRTTTLFLATLLLSALLTSESTRAAKQPPLNVLLFTADDLNCDSLGCYGSTVPDVSPNLDRFAAQSMRFDRGHVTVAICQPSRGVLATGRYPHRSGVMGFMHTQRKIPTAMQSFRDAGYLTGILGKVGHSTPHANYKWDFTHDQGALGAGRSPKKYYDYSVEFLARCQKEGKPFYFMVNSHDPHRPYHLPQAKLAGRYKEAEAPSRLYKPKEVVVPGFLPDIAGVRQETSYYFNSVRRLDDTFGRVMAALDESGFAENTIVMFLSDNGVALPFAKCNAYLASTRTPWLVRWPGVIKAGTVDEGHFISGIDFFPTVLEAGGLDVPAGLDGKSFVPLLKGESQSGRAQVHTQIDCKAGGDAVPMRCVQDANFGYIFNAWADGDHWYRNNNEGLSMKAMEEAAKTDAAIAARVKVFRYRSVEELYDLKNDPDCLKNLANDPAHQRTLSHMQAQLKDWMAATEDPLLGAFDKRDDPKAMSDIMWKEYAPYGARKQSGKRTKAKNRKKTGKKRGAKKAQ